MLFKSVINEHYCRKTSVYSYKVVPIIICHVNDISEEDTVKYNLEGTVNPSLN